MDIFWQLFEWIKVAVDILLHLDVHLSALVASWGNWTYVVLFLVMFCETGLVVTPILPGDSLLFAVGAIASLGDSELSLLALMATMFVGAVLGDAVNYHIGSLVGPKVFCREKSWFLNPKHLLHTQRFYEKHGGKTIILARFVPIVRTFAPFVAGIGKMGYRRFAIYNVTGAFLWVIPLLAAGYIFGNLPVIKRNFHVVILAIIFLSLLPALLEILKAKKENKLAQLA